jgi:hypothetical protein
MLVLGALAPAAGWGAAPPVAAAHARNAPAARARFVPSAAALKAVAGVSGTALGRHPSPGGKLGGPAPFDARHGARIDGALLRARR